MAWADWLTFDPIAVAPKLAAPVLVVHSEDAAIPAGAHQFIDTLTTDKTILWTDGTQFDFYDQPATVGLAADHAADHFRHVIGQ